MHTLFSHIYRYIFFFLSEGYFFKDCSNYWKVQCITRNEPTSFYHLVSFPQLFVSSTCKLYIRPGGKAGLMSKSAIPLVNRRVNDKFLQECPKYISGEEACVYSLDAAALQHQWSEVTGESPAVQKTRYVCLLCNSPVDAQKPWMNPTAMLLFVSHTEGTWRSHLFELLFQMLRNKNLSVKKIILLPRVLVNMPSNSLELDISPREPPPPPGIFKKDYDCWYERTPYTRKWYHVFIDRGITKIKSILR